MLEESDGDAVYEAAVWADVHRDAVRHSVITKPKKKREKLGFDANGELPDFYEYTRTTKPTGITLNDLKDVDPVLELPPVEELVQPLDIELRKAELLQELEEKAERKLRAKLMREHPVLWNESSEVIDRPSEDAVREGYYGRVRYDRMYGEPTEPHHREGDDFYHEPIHTIEPSRSTRTKDLKNFKDSKRLVKKDIRTASRRDMPRRGSNRLATPDKTHHQLPAEREIIRKWFRELEARVDCKHVKFTADTYGEVKLLWRGPYVLLLEAQAYAEKHVTPGKYAVIRTWTLHGKPAILWFDTWNKARIEALLAAMEASDAARELVGLPLPIRTTPPAEPYVPE